MQPEDDVNEDEAFCDGFEAESNDSSTWFDAQQNNTPREFDLNGPATSEEGEAAPNVIVGEEDCIEENPTAELLCPHYCFGHVSFKKLQEVAK